MDDDRTTGDQQDSAGGGDEDVSPPLEDLVERIRGYDDAGERAVAGSKDVPLDDEGLFAEEGTKPIDFDAVWKSIESGWPVEGAPDEKNGGDREHVVPKRWFCEQCEYFSEPPEVHCSNDGTTILEFIGTEDVRVRNCPVVAERITLGHYEEPELQDKTSQ